MCDPKWRDKADSLPVIAWRYGTTITNIAAQNNILNPALLYVGLPLSVTSATSQTPIATGRVIVVQPNETLFSIAVQYGQSVEMLGTANGLPVTSVLFAGQSLLIPAGRRIKALFP